MLLLLVILIAVAAIVWRVVLSKPAPLQAANQFHAAPRPQPSTPEAARIIAQAVKVYASCRSYQDTGSVTTVYQQQHRFDSVKTFRTTFVRPGRFFYEYTTREGKPKDLYAVWTVGKPIYCWWSQEPGTKIADAMYDAMERARSH